LPAEQAFCAIKSDAIPCTELFPYPEKSRSKHI
jgi:hypothetical protein